jgi:hypothetical protein
MSFAATTWWQVDNVNGSDTLNGGGFDPRNANFATDLTATSGTGSSPVVSSASYNFVSNDVGHYVFIQSGTNWIPGWYKIASVSLNAATLTASVGNVWLWTVPNTSGDSMGATGVNTSAGVATTASPSGGVWSIDYSIKGAAAISYTDLVIGGTNTQITSAANPFGKNNVGNTIAITSGSGFTVQTVQISSVTTVTATCDKAVGTAASTGGHGGLGGALASLGIAASNVSGAASGTNTIAIKQTGTNYNQSSSANVANGYMQFHQPSYVFGYTSNRYPYNSDTRPILQPTANTVNMIDCFIANGCRFFNLDAVANSHTGCVLLYDNSSSGHFAWNCRGTSITQTIKFPQGNNEVWFCEAATNDGTSNVASIQVGGGGKVMFCVNHGSGCAPTNGGTGTVGPAGSIAVGSISSGCGNNSGHSGFEGFSMCINCTSDGTTNPAAVTNGGGGFGINVGGQMVNCLATNCAGYGYTAPIGVSSTGAFGQLYNCAGYNNSSGNVNTAVIAAGQQINFKTLTANPYISAGTLNFQTNNSANAGILLRALGYPTAVLPGSLTNTYPDIGASQASVAAATAAYNKLAGPGGGLAG